jgi:hypothetical protein
VFEDRALRGDVTAIAQSSIDIVEGNFSKGYDNPDGREDIELGSQMVGALA